MMPNETMPESTPESTAKRPVKARAYRSLGLSLSIIGAFIFFGIFPVLPVVLMGALRLQGHTFIPADGAFWTLPALGVLVMIVSVFAWIGAPRRIRLYFIAIVIIAALANGYTTFQPSLLDFVDQGNGLPAIMTSFDPLFTGYLRCLLPFRVVLLVFVVWYCNRQVVRAYYDD